jgi:glycine hydroxymethyltransferase
MPYFVDEESGLIDYEGLEKRVIEFKPKLIICGFSGYPRDIDYSKFRSICDSITLSDGSHPLLMADIAHISGLVASKVLNDPF